MMTCALGVDLRVIDAVADAYTAIPLGKSAAGATPDWVRLSTPGAVGPHGGRSNPERGHSRCERCR
jgi:hypothetical protein